MSDVVVNKGLTVETFMKEIDSIMTSHGTTMLDAVLYYCEKNNIEPETAGAIIKSNLKFKSKVQADAEDLNFLPKQSKLPL